VTRCGNAIVGQACAIRFSSEPRLAVFAPLPRLGLIVVDEEHDRRSSNRTGCAITRATSRFPRSCATCRLSSASATPSLESYAQAKRGRYRWLKLTQRATSAPGIAHRCACCRTGTRETSKVISPALQRAIADRLVRHRTGAPVYQPSRFRAVAAVRGVRLESRCVALQRASGRPSRRLDAALSPLWPRGAAAGKVPRVWQPGSASSGLWHAAARAAR